MPSAPGLCTNHSPIALRVGTDYFKHSCTPRAWNIKNVLVCLINIHQIWRQAILGYFQKSNSPSKEDLLPLEIFKIEGSNKKELLKYQANVASFVQEHCLWSLGTSQQSFEYISSIMFVRRTSLIILYPGTY